MATYMNKAPDTFLWNWALHTQVETDFEELTSVDMTFLFLYSPTLRTVPGTSELLNEHPLNDSMMSYWMWMNSWIKKSCFWSTYSVLESSPQIFGGAFFASDASVQGDSLLAPDQLRFCQLSSLQSITVLSQY